MAAANKRFAATLSIALSVASIVSMQSHAGDLSLSNNALNISSDTAVIGSDGIASRLTGVTKTSGIGIPNIAFDLVQSTIPQAGSYSFRVGVVIDDDNSVRRIEAMIATVNIAVSGSTLSGSIPANTALRVLGRNTTFTVEMNTTNPSNGGPITVSGGSINFDAANFIQKIADTNPSLESIINDFGSDTHYTYQIIAQQISGPEDIRLGTVSGGNFTALPCMSASQQIFELNNALAASFSLGFGLQGQFSIVDAPGSPADAPSPFTSVCVAPPQPDGSVGGLSSDIQTRANAITIPASGPLGAESLAALQTTLSLGLTLTTETLSGLNGATTDAATALSALEALSAPLNIAGQAIGRGNALSLNSLTSLLDGITSTIVALRANTSLSAGELTRLSALTDTVISQNSALVSSTMTGVELDSLHASSTALLEQSLRSGATLRSTTLQGAQALNQALATRYLASAAANSGITIDFNNETQATNLINNNKYILDGVLRYSPSLNALSALDGTLLQSTLEGLGLSGSEAISLAASMGANLIHPNRLTLTNSLGINIEAIITSAFNNSSVTIDSVTGALLLSSGGSTLSLQATAIKLVPNAVPAGLNILANGQWLIVQGGIAIELTPTPLENLNFYALLHQANLPITLNTNGSFLIALDASSSFSGIINVDFLPAGVTDCDALSIVAPTGTQQSSGYRYELQCSGGVSQKITPYMFNEGLYQIASEAGFNMSTDLATGIFTLSGLGSFKPSFIVQTLSLADQAYLTANPLIEGIAFRAGRFNDDAIEDYEMISAQGKQILLGL